MKIEIRTTCKECGNLITGKRQRTFCSTACRNKSSNRKARLKIGIEEYNKRQRDRLSKKNEGKEMIKCLICGKEFVQVGTHIVQRHKMTARQYREEYGFDVKRGQTTGEYRKLKSRQAFECGGVKNLKLGEKHWFKKGGEGVGIYKRSEQTINRLKHKTTTK